MGVDDKIERLEKVRAAIDDAAQRKTRLEGQMDGHKKRLSELEEKCRKDYGCEVEDLPDLIEKLETEADEAIANAEELLGVK
jgi:DNA repair ATPase RecN